MRHFSLILFLTFIFTFAVSAQTNQSLVCPSLNVSGGELAKPNENTYFSANIDTEGIDLKLEYLWAVSTGEIVEGQGTKNIVVKVPEDESVTATVEVKGFPEDCRNTASETGSICRCLNAKLIDEFSIQPSPINKASFNILLNQLKLNPDSNASIIEYFKRGTPKKVIDRKIKRITNYLVNEKKLEKERFTILVKTESEKTLTTFWVVPPGAAAPVP
jgi:hypothetical protein